MDYREQKINFEKIFNEKLSEYLDRQYIIEYIDFVVDNNILGDVDFYCEKHHLLPQSIFDEYSESFENIFKLSYENHCIAHFLLAKACPIREFVRPLNWMLNESFKNESNYNELLSQAATKNWESFKNNKEKYDKWRQKRSEYMKKTMVKGSLTYEKIHEGLVNRWEKIKNDDEKYQNFCDEKKEYWNQLKKDKEKYNEHIEKLMSTVFSDEVQKRRTETIKKKYENEEYYEKFREKMTEVNKRQEKRESASKTIKQNWKSEEFRERMKNRKSRSGVKYKIVFPDGSEEIINGFWKMIEQYNFNVTLVTKFKNTDKAVTTGRSKTQKTLNTIGHKFYKIEE